MRCPSCGFENPGGMNFCGKCATPLVSCCPQCGFENPPGFAFCGKCATPLTSQSEEKGAEAKRRKRERTKPRASKRKGDVSPRLAAPSSQPPIPNPQSPAGERRQLTVMFCDLVGSTALSERLDPEELREVIRAYQQSCATVIERYEGHIAQHLGDGLLVYFGYPAAHEDDAVRAVRAGLEIIEALREQGSGDGKQGERRSLQVRVGIHTGLVVVGEVGGGAKREQLALGETPNIAARVQSQAAPNEVVVSAVTLRLLRGVFATEDLGRRELKGISTPIALYRVRGESATPSRFEAVLTAGLTPLIGRSEELALLWRHWEQAKDGEGQVVLLSGEPGIGKSRLVQELKERLGNEGATRIEFRCSPYHQNSTLYPIIDHLQHLLQFAREDPPAVKLEKLQHTLSQYHFPQADTMSLFASLLSLPHPEGFSPITISPQKQKEKTQAALVAWLVEEAEKQPVYTLWEDVHWADPSTLEVLNLIIDQAPTARLYILLTFRPEFTPPWGNRSHLSQLTLSRLGRSQVETMVERVTGGKALPSEVLQQIVAKTDGVPLFVEELTKTVVESGLLREEEDRYVGAHGGGPIPPLAIPSTLQDSLAARLDRLAPVREIAQMGATLGREFSYDLLRAVSPLDEIALQQGLRQLVEAELLYQRGLLPQVTYLFKHALIQDTAYQSLLKSTRQQYHTKIAQVLEERFPETKGTQPELVAHHYTEAGLIALAIPYWQRAGQRAAQRSANLEAIGHLTKGLELLKTLPDTRGRGQQELSLQMALGAPLTATKGTAARKVGKAYARPRELCQQLGETPQLFSVLRGLWLFYIAQAEYQTAHELAEQCLRLAQSAQDPALLLEAQYMLGNTLFYFGEFAPAREHFEQSMALYNFGQHHSHTFLYGQDTGMVCLGRVAWVICFLGYPDQALKLSYQATTLARELSHSHSQAYALGLAAALHQLRREGPAAQEQAEAAITLSTEQGFPLWVAWGTLLQGWALAKQGRGEEGTSQIRQGLAAFRATGAEVSRPYFLALLAEAHEKAGQVEEGLSSLAQALAAVENSGERWYEAELYRLKGELLLNAERGMQNDEQKTKEEQRETIPVQHSSFSIHHSEEAEACFHKAIEIARKQQAKSLELRAATSLARLWLRQGKKIEAHKMLAEIYNWFTEGFDTKDLQEARVLLEELMVK